VAVCMVDDLTPQQRAILVYNELKAKGQISNARAREITGLSRNGVLRLVSVILGALLDLDYDEKRQVWYVND
jgi:hypothetical protein